MHPFIKTFLVTVACLFISVQGVLHADIVQCTNLPNALPISEDAANPTEVVISVTTDEPVTDVDILVDIAHDYIDDVIVEIISPAGTLVRLHDQGGGSNDFINVIFDDGGAPNGNIPWDSGCRVQPSGPGSLSDLVSTSSVGDWTLRCQDTFAGGATGALSGWCLNTFDQTVSGAVLAPTNFLCRDLGGTGTVEMTWSNPQVYDEIQILSAGAIVDIIAGDATSYTLATGSVGGLLELCLLPSAAGAIPCTTTCANLTTQAITPSLEQCSTPASVVGNTVPETIDIINIGTDIEIGDLQVQVDVQHPFVGDLIVDLSHAGTTVRLHNENGGAATQVEATFWDLGAAQGTTGVNCGCPLQPTGPGVLGDFNGSSTLGDWTLLLDDVFAGGGPRIGSLDSWCLRAFELGSVTDLICDTPSGSTTSTLTWNNPQTFDAFEIYANGVLETIIPDGTATSYVTAPQTLPAQVIYCIVPLLTGEIVPQNCCEANFLVQPMTDVLANAAPGTGEITANWVNADVYDQISVYVDGNLEATLAGDATTWTGGSPSVPGTAIFCLEASQNGFVSDPVCRNVALLQARDYSACRTPGSPINQAVSPVTDIIFVPQNNLIGDIDVLVDLRHPFIGDLTVDLASPGGVGIRLHDLQGGADADMNVVYSNGAPANAGPYDCGCAMEASGPGSMQDFINTPSIGPWLMSISDIFPGNISTFDRWCLQIDAGCQTLPPQDVTAVSNGTEVTLGWTNASPYDEIQLVRNGAIVATGISGTSTSYVDTPPPGAYEYQLIGFDFTQGCSNTSDTIVAGVGITDVVWIGETGGNILSGALLADSLFQLGRMVMTVDTLTPDLMDRSGVPEVLWACLGTYPERYELTAADGLLLAEFHTGDDGLDGSPERAPVSIYIESNDAWGYDPQTIFANYDGVEDTSLGNVENGDDSLVSLVGFDSGYGLDCSFLDAPYSQDSAGNDYTDRLVPCDQNPDLGGNRSGVIWQGSDLFGPYTVGIHYDSDIAPVISQTWEIGGYGNDIFQILPLYLVALENNSTPPPADPQFIRGDVNNDGGRNVADAIFLLASLFVPGSPSASCADSADCNDDGGTNVADAVFLLNNLFIPGSSPIPAPGTTLDCGVDPTADSLDCQSTGTSCP
jgi:subtilisin-like proprotein convertase family protein